MDWKDIPDGEIIEPEDYREDVQTFNHQSLVMSAIKKCLELGSKELREGWYNEKVDKNGNITKTYMEDTRKAFIESVKSLLMVVTCDFDDKARTEVNALLQSIEERKKYWLDQEFKWWNSLNNSQKQNYAREGKQVVEGFFNRKLNFDNFFFEEEVEIYRKICAEVNNLTARLDFYGTVGYIG